MKDIVLASASPRRAALLRQLGIKFQIKPSNIAEENFNNITEPSTLVKALAKTKAETIASQLTNALVIGADTIVTLENRILGKPKDAAEAKEMLRLLSGKEHSVFTGLAIIDTPKQRSQVVALETKVLFRELKEREIDAYVASGDSLDKAGAYGIQGKGATLVESIKGCYFNVVGLPLQKLVLMLEDFQFSIW